MSRWLSACLAAGLLFALVTRADEPVPPPRETPPPVAADACGPTISVPKFYLQEIQTATTLPRTVLRDEVIGVQPGGPVLDYVEQRQFITVLEMRPHPVEQEVTCITSQPITTVDSCGKPCTIYQPVPVVKKVVVTVVEPVSVQKEVIVSVPVLRPGRDLVVRRLAADQITIPAVESRFNLLTVPNEVAAPAPPPWPVPACPGPSCPEK